MRMNMLRSIPAHPQTKAHAIMRRVSIAARVLRICASGLKRMLDFSILSDLLLDHGSDAAQETKCDALYLEDVG